MKTRFPLLIPVLILCSLAISCRQPEPVPFLKGNFHTHSYWSDGNMYPEEVARWYRDHGYQFLAMTDHNLIQQGIKKRVVNGDTVILRELADYRREFEKPGEFLILSSEEISDQSEKKPVHLNGINLDQAVKPSGGATVQECLTANVEAIRQALRTSGNTEWITVNHPNFGWGLATGDLAQCGARFFEVFNGHPSVHNYGDSVRPGTETMWDLANKWRIDHGEPLLLGIATDDAHQYDRFETGKANPGRGWTMVRAAELTPEALYQAMLCGDFYASTGVELDDFRISEKSMVVRIKSEEGVQYKTEFLGWKAGANQPEILKTVMGSRAAYRPDGRELFVRARITSDKVKANPFAQGDHEMAWLQPVVLK